PALLSGGLHERGHRATRCMAGANGGERRPDRGDRQGAYRRSPRRPVPVSSTASARAATLTAGRRSLVKGSSALVPGLLGIAAFFALWWLGAERTRFIPPIGQVIAEYPAFLTSDVWSDIGASTSRVVLALIVALAF